jgi:hypothetical protein
MLIFLTALIAMVVFYIIYVETMFTSTGEIAEKLSSIAFWVVFVSFIIFALVHIGTDSKIVKNEIRYNTLINEVKIADSGNDDAAKVLAIQNVSEWNQKVKVDQYWTYNPWTSWYHNKKVVDAEKTIELPDWDNND